MISDYLRKKACRYFTNQDEVAFSNNIPGSSLIGENLDAVKSLGLYLHIPFCERICPYCPYNREVYNGETSENYVQAVLKEIDFYAPLLNDKSISSFYIGGGTPTTMLGKGIEKTRITTIGYGFSKPRAGNDTKNGRALNRRAELIPVKQFNVSEFQHCHKVTRTPGFLFEALYLSGEEGVAEGLT